MYYVAPLCLFEEPDHTCIVAMWPRGLKATQLAEYLSAIHYSTYPAYQTCEYDPTGEFTEFPQGFLNTREQL